MKIMIFNSNVDQGLYHFTKFDLVQGTITVRVENLEADFLKNISKHEDIVLKTLLLMQNNRTLLPFYDWTSATCGDTTGHFLEIYVIISIFIKGVEKSF